MEFKQIEAFIKIVELSSFSRAADELYISQPSISTYMNSLEHELGATLINRSTKVLSMTFAGERFFEQAKKMVALKNESIEMLKILDTDISGEIGILASSVPALYILPCLFADFRNQYPNISFSVKQADTASVVKGICEHKADIGFVGSVMSGKTCDYIGFVDEELIFIAPNNGAYSSHKTYTLEELLYANHFISRELGSGTRMQYEKYFLENGIRLDELNICATMDSTHSILAAVESGLGISIVSEVAVRQMIKQNQVLRLKLKTKLPKRKIYTVLNKKISHSHLIKLFVNYLIDHV